MKEDIYNISKNDVIEIEGIPSIQFDVIMTSAKAVGIKVYNTTSMKMTSRLEFIPRSQIKIIETHPSAENSFNDYYKIRLPKWLIEKKMK